MVSMIVRPALLALCLGFLHARAATPNLVLIVSDDQGYADVGFNGCQDIPTPHLDSIAASGVNFTNGYVTFPVCGPSRAGLLTGRYQDRFGFTTNPSTDPENEMAGLPVEEEMISEILKKVGYTSAIIGKWHMGTHPRFHPHKRGFDHFFGFLAGGLNYMPEMLTLNDFFEVKRQWGWYSMKVEEDGQKIDIDDYLTDELTDAATRFIDRQAPTDKPFFLYLAYNAPHTPMQATEKYLSRFPGIENERRRTYAAMVSAMDDGVGRVLEALRRHGIEEETLVIFLSDNGGASNNASRNTPLRGHKSAVFEGGIRVPFALQWKGTVPAGQVFADPIISLDILATMAGITGVPIAEERPLDGVNLIPYVTGKEQGAPHETLYWRKWEQGAMAIRSGDDKVLRTNRDANTLLFNLEADVSERRNLAESDAATLQELQAMWEAWNAQLKDRVFPTLMDDKWWTR